MKIPEAIERDYDRWDHFLEQQVDFSLKGSEKHTKSHCGRVLLYALLIAGKMDLSLELWEVLGAAAVFHDSRRQDDWLDVGHGQRAADYYKKFCRTNPLVYDERVYRIMAYHDREDALGEAALSDLEHGVLLYRIFKDADALDRFRLGEKALDEDMLRTAPARSLTDFARYLVAETAHT